MSVSKHDALVFGPGPNAVWRQLAPCVRGIPASLSQEAATASSCSDSKPHFNSSPKALVAYRKGVADSWWLGELILRLASCAR